MKEVTEKSNEAPNGHCTNKELYEFSVLKVLNEGKTVLTNEFPNLMQEKIKKFRIVQNYNHFSCLKALEFEGYVAFDDEKCRLTNAGIEHMEVLDKKCFYYY